jgi:predicted dehydrogenase
VETAGKNGLALMTGHTFPNSPAVRKIQKLSRRVTLVEILEASSESLRQDDAAVQLSQGGG